MLVHASRSTRARSQTVERAALILTCFTSEEPHLGLPALAAKLGLNQSTAYRYVASLQRAGLLSRDDRRGGYRLGLRLIELAGIALNQIEVRKHALDEMDKLRDGVSLLVNLAVLLEGDVLHLAHSAPRALPRMYTALGRRAVAHCTALGKVLLAHRPWDEVRQLIERYGWRPYTEHSIRELGRLQTELQGIRERGYAVDKEERRRDVVCLAAPIRDYSGSVVAALSVSGRKARMTPERQRQLLPRVLEAANRISFRLGFHGNAAYL
ncbi:MAG: IclR family transcriptional regulator [Candidatus Rokubacteria bacterium]|nr:IclR family transcriptional regulator [Candidatus Rokubacteria bacterium]